MTLFSRKLFLGILLWLTALRLFFGNLIPLTETTEARYGEIARKMLETGNWVNLLDTYTTPFWAKPPLYGWLSALSMGMLGVSEFAARLPSMLVSLTTLWIIYDFARNTLNLATAQLAALILFTSAGFLVASDTVMTDPSLMFAVTLGLCAWWRHHETSSRVWGYVFFAAVGLGLVAKGPLAIVLLGMPIFFYLLLRGGWAQAIKALPWVGGILVGFVLPGLWYAAAESRTPGFLEYFLLGEHVYRFIKPGWAGDLYGHAHAEPRGIIWLFATAALLPWTVVAIAGVIKGPRKFLHRVREHPLRLFLLCWTLSHLVFFSLPANIIWPYYLPMAPAFALLVADFLGQNTDRGKRLSYVMLGVTSVALIIAGWAALSWPEKHIKSGKSIIARWQEDRSQSDGSLAYLSGKRLFSLEFYSSGKATRVGPEDLRRSLLDNKTLDYLIVNEDEVSKLPPDVANKFTRISQKDPSKLRLVLLKELP